MKKPMILATALTALLAVPFAHAEDLPGKGVKITPVQSTISEETFQTLLVEIGRASCRERVYVLV